MRPNLRNKFDMKPALEKPIQQAVIAYATMLGVHSIRMFFGPGMQVGWPDVLFLIPGGRPLFIEFKATGKKPTAKQRKKIRLLRDEGYDVAVCDTIAAGKDLIFKAVEAADVMEEDLGETGE